MSSPTVHSGLENAVETAAAGETSHQTGADAASSATSAAVVTAVVLGEITLLLRRSIWARLGRVRALSTRIRALLLVVVTHLGSRLVVTGRLALVLLLLIGVGSALVRSAAVGRLRRVGGASIGRGILVLGHDFGEENVDRDAKLSESRCRSRQTTTKNVWK